MRIESTVRGSVVRFALGLLAGTALTLCSAGCSTAGWGPAPVATAAPMAQRHALSSAHDPGTHLAMDPAKKIPPNIRVQDCGVVTISSPSKYVCPNGKVYTTFDLARARMAREQ
jgi:hypothetical protein